MIQKSLDDLFDFLRFQSISADPAYADEMRRCAGWLDVKFKGLGFESSVYPTAGHPVVVARSLPRPDRRTVLIYGHYDVQPADPIDLWASPPFEPRIENGIIYARGVADNKGQIMAHILGVEETLKKTGDLPVNVIFLVEGEEETGSPHLEDFLHHHSALLRPDVIVLSDTSMAAPNTPSRTYGLRGILALELWVRSADRDLHSGTFGGAAPNAALSLAKLLGALHDNDFRVQIPGFYDNVLPVQSWEHEEWARLPSPRAAPQGPDRQVSFTGEKGFTYRERIWTRPTAEINGISGGYQGRGSKTVIPGEAFAKLTFRLVPNQTPEEIEEKARAYFASLCPPYLEINITVDHGGMPFFCDPHTKDGMAAQRAVKRSWGSDLVLIRGGGTIAILPTFHRIFGVDIILLGLASPDCNSHAPNENLPLKNVETGVQMNRALLEELAGV